MPHEVYVFGDSHWRVYFPFLNTGAPGICHESKGIVTLDTTANELSGATMYGLRKEQTRIGARKRILDTIDGYGSVENVGLVFGEVDLRYHYERYFRDGMIHMPSVLDLVLGYRRFIEDDLIRTGRVQNKVFVYYGFRYSQEFVDSFGPQNYLKVQWLNRTLERLIEGIAGLPDDPYGGRIIPIIPGRMIEQNPGGYDRDDDLIGGRYKDDGVHMNGNIYNDFILPVMSLELGTDAYG